ncbi:arginine--tRNA ligase [Candidatus Bathyarchaeota archaeon]|nr:arginine--tRNA ligase [Candidatus Bathyarchaeota archaeon]MBL7168952.1 arginine--tRNA ligase [Candidatus Bathyarchaeota archaeon]
MSNPLAKLREECTRLLEEALNEAYPGTELPSTRFSTPPNPEMGELSSAASFQLARSLRSRPAEIAEKIAEKVSPSSLVESAEAVNGYVNFKADTGSFSKLVLETVEGEDEEYGFLKTSEPERVMVEHTSANPISPLHIGNARNSILGDCLAKLLKKRGHEVAIHFLVNDVGRQVAMTGYGWQLLGKPKPEGRAELWVGTIYAGVNVVNELTRLRKELRQAEERGKVNEIAEYQEEIEDYEKAVVELRNRYADVYDALAEKLPTIEDPVAEIVKLNTAYENNEPEAVKDMREVVGYCLQGFETSLGELDIGFESFDFESDLVWRNAAEEVLEELKATPYVFEDEGALIMDCDRVAVDMGLKERWGLNLEHEIPRLVLVRKDGTTLYTLRDMAYSIWKFGLADRVINVIGSEQRLAQLQLRIALAAMGRLEMGDNQMHYAYELVYLPGVKMSGRLGRYVTMLDVVQRAEKLAYEAVDIRSPHLTKEDKEEIARMVGHGAIKYTLLSVDPQKTVTFDWEKALNFETNSAPYIQYSHARACNILKRAEEKPEPDYGGLTHPKERELLIALASFPETFEGAVTELKPGDITAYANNLADKFNSFYAAVPVLKAETPGLLGARLALVDAVRIVQGNALSLLGIKAPERM